MRLFVVVATVVAGLLAVGIFGVRGSSLTPVNGDVDCDNLVNIGDAIKIARHSIALTSQQQPGCPPIGGVPSPTNPPAVGLSRSNPVPMGQPYLVPEGWRIEILDFIPDATQIVMDENQFNDPPAAGFRFSIVRVRMSNVSAGNPADPDAGYALRMVGSRNVGYSTFRDSCGVIPEDLDFMSFEVFEGGSVEGNVCYQTGVGETGFAIYTNFFLSDDEDVRWFEVK